MSEEEIKCHGDLSHLRLSDWKLEWTEKRHGNHPSRYSHCSYCGSIHFDDIRTIAAEGGHMGGSDWKYGYPHKFYVTAKNGEMVKFYPKHLEDLKDPEKFTEIAALLKQQTNIEFTRNEEGHVMYCAPYHGYQKA